MTADPIVVIYSEDNAEIERKPFPGGVPELLPWLRKNARKDGRKLHIHAPSTTTDEERRQIREAAGGVEDVFEPPPFEPNKPRG